MPLIYIEFQIAELFKEHLFTLILQECNSFFLKNSNVFKTKETQVFHMVIFQVTFTFQRKTIPFLFFGPFFIKKKKKNEIAG